MQVVKGGWGRALGRDGEQLVDVDRVQICPCMRPDAPPGYFYQITQHSQLYSSVRPNLAPYQETPLPLSPLKHTHARFREAYRPGNTPGYPA